MAQDLSGMKVAFMVATEGVEQVELTTPWEASIGPAVCPSWWPPRQGRSRRLNHLEKADSRVAPR